MVTRNEDRVEEWERHTAGPLTALAVGFLVAYAVPILWPDIPAAVRDGCDAATFGIWFLFVVDYAVRLWLTPDRLRFVRSHLFDLAVLFFPMFRPLRALRVLAALTMIHRRADVWTRGSLAVYVGATTVLLLLVSALAILEAERPSPDANIASYADALWWAMATVTTVGYGDHYPTTRSGQLVALGLMLGGIGLLGFVTGSLASWIMDKVSAAEHSQEATRADIAEVVAALNAIRSELAALRAGIGSQSLATAPSPAGPAPLPPASTRDDADSP